MILIRRNLEKGNSAKENITKEMGNENIIVMNLDTSSQESVRDFVEEFKKLDLKIYGLINNAGISGMKNGTSVDNLDLVMTPNYLGHFLLTNLILPSTKMIKLAMPKRV